MELVILFSYFASSILGPSAGYSKDTELTIHIHEEVDKLLNKYPDDMSFKFGVEVARGLLLPIIAALRSELKNKDELQNIKDEFQKFVIKKKDDEIKKKNEEINALRLPAELKNEIDEFFEMNSAELTTAEEKIISNLNDTDEKTRMRLVKTCEHIITDLSTDIDISELINEIDLAEYENLSKLSKAERINIVCTALVWLKFDKNAVVHDVFLNGSRVNRIKIFTNEVWNEGVVAFINGHRTGVLPHWKVVYKA